MSRQIVVVDPLFPRRLRDLRTQRGLTLRDVSALANYSHTYIWEIEKGRKQPTPPIAARLDKVLQAQGALAALVSTTSTTAALDPDDADRLCAVAARPRSADLAVVGSLGAILARQRRMEDAVGSGSMVGPVVAQLVMVESLVADAHGSLRRPVLEMASHWAQFAGWLHASTQQPVVARRWYGTALEWASEINDANMIATALNMRGHLAWMAHEVGPMIGLSQAAGRLPAGPGVRALAVQQEARGHALAAEGDDTDRLLDEALELATRAAAHPEDEPPWIYFHNPDYLNMQRGLAYRYLGRFSEAADLLIAGLAAMPPDMRRSEWVGWYVYQLGLTHLQAGERDGALAAAVEIEELAATFNSAMLSVRAGRLRDRLHPGS